MNEFLFSEGLGFSLGVFLSYSSELLHSFFDELFTGDRIGGVVAVIFSSEPFGKVFLPLDEVTDFFKLVD